MTRFVIVCDLDLKRNVWKPASELRVEDFNIHKPEEADYIAYEQEGQPSIELYDISKPKSFITWGYN